MTTKEKTRKPTVESATAAQIAASIRKIAGPDGPIVNLRQAAVVTERLSEDHRRLAAFHSVIAGEVE